MHRAANECLNEGILTEFFNEYWNEVEEMFSLMYDEQEAIKVAKEETIETILEIVRAYREGKSISEIAAQHDIQADKIEKIIAEIFP
ncbi:MAG: helix-turn-helix domain containing protein [Clostridia bacterium]|nr:helix-turn-helix domain containing protein [Clostridia bacterium]